MNWQVLAAQTAIGFVRRNVGTVALGVAAAVVGVFVMGATIVSALVAGPSSDSESVSASACSELGYQVDTAYTAQNPVPVGGPAAGFAAGEDEQLADARIIINVGQAADVPDQGLVIAIATALQESGLRNLSSGDRDSAGVFQQRPSQGWGTTDQVTDVTYAARAFYGGPSSPLRNPTTGTTEPPGLLDIPGWQDMELTDAAQAVQRSGFPTAYAKHESRARTIVTALTSQTGQPDQDDTVMTADDIRASGVDIDNFCAEHFELVQPVAVAVAGNTAGTGAWGGYSNGRIPTGALATLSWSPNHRLRPDAAAALEQLDAAYLAKFGKHISITDSYRTYDQQVAVKLGKGWLAATPGTSNHGWALAVDLGGGIQSFSTPQHAWMVTNGPSYGWHLPNWAQATGSKPEPWHFEYQ